MIDVIIIMTSVIYLTNLRKLKISIFKNIDIT